MNSLWTITYGTYQLAVDRRTLTYSLTETKTNTVWADDLSLGWMEIKNRQTGEVTRHPFGEMKIFSISEKAGAQGKRILFGLDCQGIPVDIYLIGSEREIQIVLESNRDSRTHTVEGFGLCPGLCSVSWGGGYLVIPNKGGAIVRPEYTPKRDIRLPIWDTPDGLTMPFVGAVRTGDMGSSVLTLITDSAYGCAILQRHGDTHADLGIEFSRDPERRRLDLRLLLNDNGDYITVARNYREKIISDRNHLTLRRKMQEKPELNKLTGSVLYSFSHWKSFPSIIALAERLSLLHPTDQSIFEFAFDSDGTYARDGFDHARAEIRALGFHYYGVPDNFLGVGRSTKHPNLWEYMDERLQASDSLSGELLHGGSLNEWAAPVTDFVQQWSPGDEFLGKGFAPLHHPYKIAYSAVPLLSVAYHDCFIWHHFIEGANWLDLAGRQRNFLDALITLSAPMFKMVDADASDTERNDFAFMERVTAVLPPLHTLCFSAFLVSHRFLTPDCLVEEAVYSNQTRIVINRSETETYQTEELALPPLGFYVQHRQMEAFDALRIGENEYQARAWRVVRSRDGKPLEQSGDIQSLEFPIPQV